MSKVQAELDALEVLRSEVIRLRKSWRAILPIFVCNQKSNDVHNEHKSCYEKSLLPL